MSTPTGVASFTLAEDELQIVGARLGIADFPTVLAIRSRHDRFDALEQAQQRAVHRLTAGGLLEPDGAVAGQLAAVVQVLQRPARELALRLVTPDGIARVSVARTGHALVSARRVGNEITLRSLEPGADLETARRGILAELPGTAAAHCDPFGAPAAELAACLDGGHDTRYLTDRLRGLGAAHQCALALGAAFGTRVAFAEITCHSLDPVADRVIRTPGAVAVFYTGRGRLVSAPSLSPSGQLWATIKSGTDHRIRQAVTQLTELIPGGWEGDIQ